MNTGNSVIENTNASVECRANNASPAGSVDMEFSINAKQTNIIPEVTETPGSNNGMIKTFVFTFTADRKQNGMTARCHLLWDGKHINISGEENLNITCE